jgi:predicted HAD superfamily phosphohydrolase
MVDAMEFDGLEEVLPYDGKVLVTDCEGPITNNDIALELCEKFIPKGRKFFSAMSIYDEKMAREHRRKDYKHGDALRLILPFLRAFGLDDRKMDEVCHQNLKVLPGAAKTMRFVQEFMVPFIVSTSYEHYIAAACDAIDFPFESSICTRLSLDSVRMEEFERKLLKDYACEIAAMEGPLLAMRASPDGTREGRDAFSRVDEIMWAELVGLRSREFINEVHTVGDIEKAAASADICKKTGLTLEECMYVGDGITDVKAMEIVRQAGGLSVSFNGDADAVAHADVAVMAGDTTVTSILAEAFYRAGKDSVLDLVDHWDLDALASSGLVHDYLVKEASRVFPGGLPIVRRVTPRTLEATMAASCECRRAARGDLTSF